ncbi:MAG TPA: histidine kinase, partial [Cyanobacteria bacterium UBA11148]|nr:histidine kinase [Cyanobacteria bacterium UBA11148]
MNLCSVFQLNVLRTGLDCTFQLSWGERQQIVVSCPYPTDLKRLYNNWKACYERAYEGSMRGRVEDDFSLTPSGDWTNKAEEAKERLLQRFQQWLGSAELLEIRKPIQNEAVRKRFQDQGKTEGNNCVDLLIACNHLELIKLPWEAWDIAPNDSSLAAIHISRTPLNAGNEGLFAQTLSRRGKPRILVILADATELDLKEDQKAVRLLKKVAEVEAVKFESGDIKQQFIDRLLDERGWDALIFAGHSDETDLTGGKIELAAGVTLSISEIEYQLTEAKNRGLRVAIFNSCSGLCIAESLIQLGLSQVVVMREKIHDTVAHGFLHRLCQGLAGYKDIQTALWQTCEYFESEKYAYPSAYLIPSLFRHPSPQVDLFRIEPLGLKRFLRTWKPTRGEAIMLSTALVLSVFPPVQDLLLDVRQLSQAVYRDLTQQLPQGTPPVRFIAIDQESINEEGFNAQQMSRAYLAKLVDKIAEFNVKTVGIDYLLHSKESGEVQLANSIESAIKKHNTWFILAVNEEQNLRVHPDIAKPQWMLQGDVTFFLWDMKLPNFETCSLFNVEISGDEQSCPFSYLLALSHLVKQNQALADFPEPRKTLTRPTTSSFVESFQNKLKQFIKQNREKERVIT